MKTIRIKDLFVSEKAIMIKPELAALVGINTAAILSQIEYWLKVLESRPQNFKDHFTDGRWWVYNTYEQWQKDNFPWMSVPTLQRAFYKLRDEGLIITREHENFKKGIWVTINYDKLGELIAGFYSHQNDEQTVSYPHQNDEQTAVPEITIQRIHNSAKADNPPEAKPAVQNLMKLRAKQLEAPKPVEEVAPKARDITGTALVQAVLKAFDAKEFRFSARLSDRLGKPFTVRVGDTTTKYEAPVDLYDNDPDFRTFIKIRLEQLKNVQRITIGTAFQNLINFTAMPTEERPNRLYGYYHWRKMNAHLLAQRKPEEVVTRAPLPIPDFDSLI